MNDPKRRQAGSVTYYPALDHFRDYLDGEITLEEFRRCDKVAVTEPLYVEEPAPSVAHVRDQSFAIGFGFGLFLGVVVTLVYLS